MEDMMARTVTIDLAWPVKKARTLLRGFRTKADPTYQTLLLQLGPEPLWTKKDIAKLTEAGYQNCSTVYSCVTMIVESAAMVPWQLFRRPISKESKKEKIDEHDILARLRRPNPREGGAAFRQNALAYYLIAGNSYMIRVGPDEGPPGELYTMRPDRVKILPGTQFQPIRGYRYTVSGRPRKPDFKAEEVLHLKAFHPLDDWYGLSKIQVAGKEIDIAGMGRAWNMKLLQNDARPSGALSMEGNMTIEQRDDLKEQIKEEHQGYENVGNPLVLEGGLKWQSFALTPKDMDWLNSDKMTLRRICAVFHVPPQLVSDEEAKTFANYKEARKALYLEAILPLLSYLRDELNNWLTPAWGEDRLYLDYDRDSIEAIREELSAVYERQEKAWWRTINERRLTCGDGEIGKKGDVILIPANLTPLADISGNITEE
jgi:HK97 family phage portal protein